LSDSAYRRCCGIDVHKKSVTVHVLPPDGSRGEDKSRVFRTFTRDLERLQLWLRQCKVTDVVMESTGQYWRPVWNVLEGGGLRLLLMNPQHVRGLRGRKTDPGDAKWLAGHLARGELQGSFVAPLPVRELRELTRLRVHLLQDSNRVKNRIGQVCETGNVKISSVASDLFGATGRHLLQGILEGKRDAAWMADWARGKLRSRRGELRLALEGRLSEHQRQLLRRLLEQLAQLETHIQKVTSEIESRVADQCFGMRGTWPVGRRCVPATTRAAASARAGVRAKATGRCGGCCARPPGRHPAPKAASGRHCISATAAVAATPRRSWRWRTGSWW